jgi:hypothetical protein
MFSDYLNTKQNTTRDQGRFLMQDSDSKKKNSRVRRPAQLTDALNRRLNGYAVAAAAAGVSILAIASPAEGSPICGKLSASLENTTTVPFNPATMPAAPFNVAQSAFQYFLSTTGVSSLRWWNRGFFTPNSKGAKVVLGDKNWPANLALGAQIGPSAQFGRPASYGLLFTYGKGNFSVRGSGTKLQHRGNVNLTQENYLGFQFSQSGNVHYGWIRISVGFHKGAATQTILNLIDYGYESTPDTAIAAGGCSNSETSSPATPETQSSAPQGASLGLLALGSAGVRE